MSAFNSCNKQELKISLFYEVIMSFVIEKHCYNGDRSGYFFIIYIKFN